MGVGATVVVSDAVVASDVVVAGNASCKPGAKAAKRLAIVGVYLGVGAWDAMPRGLREGREGGLEGLKRGIMLYNRRPKSSKRKEFSSPE